MADGPKKRLFVAVGLPAEVKDSLQDLQSELKRFARAAKWVRPEGIHLTLKFLGYVEPERIQGILAALAGVASGRGGPVPIQVMGCGVFPNTRRPNVLWAGIVAPELLPLQSLVEESMAGQGFEKEQRPFQPHLTLARFRDYHGLTPLMLEVEKKKDLGLGEFLAREIRLYESILHREGAEYRVLQEFAL